MMEVMAVLWRNVSEVMTYLWFFSPLFSSQLLYSSYLLSSATRAIGVAEEIRREVYDRMMPTFEELFDNVEEHTLNILLEPWTLLVNRDKESFQKVTTVHSRFNSCLKVSFSKSEIIVLKVDKHPCFDKKLSC